MKLTILSLLTCNLLVYLMIAFVDSASNSSFSDGNLRSFDVSTVRSICKRILGKKSTKVEMSWISFLIAKEIESWAGFRQNTNDKWEIRINIRECPPETKMFHPTINKPNLRSNANHLVNKEQIGFGILDSVQNGNNFYMWRTGLTMNVRHKNWVTLRAQMNRVSIGAK